MFALSNADDLTAVEETSMAESSGEEDCIEDDELWTVGDVTVISSDSVRFRVAGLTLAWSSPVFADMLSLPGDQKDKTIQLSDETIEAADVIRTYLDLVSVNFERLGIFYKAHCQWISLLMDLTRFLDKYQSERGLRLLRSFAASSFTMKSFSKSGDLIFAARLNDLALCYRILSSRTGSSRADTNQKPLGTIEGDWRLSFAHESYALASAIPFPFQWALARAAVLEDPKKSQHAFAHKFVELMDEIYEQGERRRVWMMLTPRPHQPVRT